MGLSVRVVKELQAELRDLEAVRDSAAARIRAIELILKRAAPASRPAGGGGSSIRPSLRARVVSTLERSKATAAEVARRLEADGFRVGGSTTLRERVAHEMSRLRRKGVLRRSRTGEYELAREPDRADDMATDPLSTADALALN